VGASHDGMVKSWTEKNDRLTIHCKAVTSRTLNFTSINATFTR